MTTPTPIINELLPMTCVPLGDPEDDECEVRLEGQDQTYIGKIDSVDGYNLEIAESIVTAVNNHARLMEENQVMREALQEILDGNTMKGQATFTHADVMQKHYQIARKALALAGAS